MTAREVWEGMLTELSKVNAPSMLLQDFNYFFNKAINQYINKRYNIYDINQQTSDDLRVLKATTILNVNKSLDKEEFNILNQLTAGRSKIFGATYEVNLPQDYLHILNCICIYRVNKDWKCYNAGDYVQFAAKRLTADSWSIICNDYYNRPLPERPYFYIHNVNTSETLPTNPLTESNPNGTDIVDKYEVGNTVTQYFTTEPIRQEGSLPIPIGVQVYVKQGKVYSDSDCTTELPVKIDSLSSKRVEGESNKSNFPRTIQLGAPANRTVSTVQKDAGTRYGNASKVRMEIRYGQK